MTNSFKTKAPRFISIDHRLLLYHMFYSLVPFSSLNICIFWSLCCCFIAFSYLFNIAFSFLQALYFTEGEGSLDYLFLLPSFDLAS
jgi:hypothetical protein